MNIFKEIIFVFKNWSKIETPLNRILSVGDEFILVSDELNKGVKDMNKCLWSEETVDGDEICIIRSSVNHIITYCDKTEQDKKYCRNYEKPPESEDTK